jgi:hypothetical protein
MQSIEERQAMIAVVEEVKRQLAIARREAVSMIQDGPPASTSRKDSQISAVSQEVKKPHNPVEDMIMQKSNQIMIQQMEHSHK